MSNDDAADKDDHAEEKRKFLMADSLAPGLFCILYLFVIVQRLNKVVTGHVSL